MNVQNTLQHEAMPLLTETTNPQAFSTLQTPALSMPGYPRLLPASSDPALLPAVQPEVAKSRSKPAKRVPAYSDEQWNSKKDIIHRLYKVENRKWKDSKHPERGVKEILRVKYDFPLT